jgi:hypothetical protein
MARHSKAVDPKLVAALAAQQVLVDEWAAESGPFDEESLQPFLEAARRAQVRNTLRVRAERRPAPS